MSQPFMRKSDIYGTSTNAVFGKGANSATVIQSASGDIGQPEAPANAPVLTIVAFIVVLIGARFLFELV